MEPILIDPENVALVTAGVSAGAGWVAKKWRDAGKSAATANAVVAADAAMAVVRAGHSAQMTQAEQRIQELALALEVHEKAEADLAGRLASAEAELVEARTSAVKAATQARGELDAERVLRAQAEAALVLMQEHWDETQATLQAEREHLATKQAAGADAMTWLVKSEETCRALERDLGVARAAQAAATAGLEAARVQLATAESQAASLAQHIIVAAGADEGTPWNFGPHQDVLLASPKGPETK